MPFICTLLLYVLQVLPYIKLILTEVYFLAFEQSELDRK